MVQFKEKIIISIVGLTNVGKSTLFNLISGQKNRAIVDSKSGTTADNVNTVMEIHGLGVVKLIDTPGVDESCELGEKKRIKTKHAINVSDLVLFVIKNNRTNFTDYEKEFLDYIKQQDKQILLINNCFDDNYININYDYKVLTLNANDFNNQLKVTNFIIENINLKKEKIDLLPNIKVENSYILLIIPLDEESPELRLLRPQSMVIERLLAKFAMPILYRPNLKNFDVNDFKNVINDLKSSKNGLSLIITDSQVVGQIIDYIPKDINFTTFSILMTNFMSNGKVEYMLNSLKTLDNLNNDDNILIVEACKHDRKCDDIATVKIPNLLKKYTGKNLNIQFNFGNVFPTEEEIFDGNYKLVIICGSCMIDKQEYQNRLRIFLKFNIPVINYGMFFSYIKEKNLLFEKRFVF